MHCKTRTTLITIPILLALASCRDAARPMGLERGFRN